MNSLLNEGKILAIQLFFGMTCFLAATPKWREVSRPTFGSSSARPGSPISFGSRLTGKFDVATINLLYFVGALLSFRETARTEPLEVRM